MEYPYFLGPDEHRLGAYYRTLQRLGFALMPVVFVLNEFLVRTHLDAYQQTPDRFWSLFVLTLNGQMPPAQWAKVYWVIVTYFIALTLVRSMLPKWNTRASKVILRSSFLPILEIDDYRVAYFYIKNLPQKIVFLVWHWVATPSGFFIGSLLPCMGVNFIRSIS
jgi:hypothetical protein